MAGRLTIRDLLKDLRAILEKPDTVVRYTKMDKYAGTGTYDTKPIRNLTITLDPRWHGCVQVVLHELLHVYMDERLGMRSSLSDTIEEEAILAWETQLRKYLARRPTLNNEWYLAIQRKIRRCKRATRRA